MEKLINKLLKDTTPKFNGKPCKEGCNCIDIEERRQGGQIKNYPCLDNTYGETYFNPETMDKKPTAEEEIKEEFSDTDISLLGEVNTKDLIERLSSVAETHANNAVEGYKQRLLISVERWEPKIIPKNILLSMMSDATNNNNG